MAGVDDDDDHYDAYYDSLLCPDPIKESVDNAEVLTGSRSDHDDDYLYLVPYRWWKAACDHCFADDEIKGVPFRIHSYHFAAEEILEIVDNSEIDVDMKREDMIIDDEGLTERSYALLRPYMWSTALKWHFDNSPEIEDHRGSFALEDNEYPILIILYFSSGTMSVRLCKEINKIGKQFERALWIFDKYIGMVRLWDFTGRIVKEWAENQPLIQGGHSDQRYVDVGMTQTRAMDDVEEKCSSEVTLGLWAYGLFQKGLGKTGQLGLTGLLNIGHTGFMNCAIQCLAHTPKLVDYFLGDYKKDINYNNTPGSRGELALAFGELLRQLWAPRKGPADPKDFKSVFDAFASRLAGAEHQDPKEFLIHLLDGLHEDLNQGKTQFAVGTKSASIVVDLFHGLYRSNLVCSICKTFSATFQSFVHLPLPLPLPQRTRSMTVTVISTDGHTPPSAFTVAVQRHGSCKDLIKALSTECSLPSEEELLLAEVIDSRIYRFLSYPYYSLTILRNSGQLVAYRLPKKSWSLSLVVFLHEQVESEEGKRFGIPLVARISTPLCESEICGVYAKLLRPFHKASYEAVGVYDDIGDNDDEDTTIKEVAGTSSNDLRAVDEAVQMDLGVGFQFHLTDEQGLKKGSKMEFRKVLDVSNGVRRVDVLVSWSRQMMGFYDTELLSLLPEICKPEISFKATRSVSLYQCLETFFKEEPLDPRDVRPCPSCKETCQAIRKLDLWRLPDILVIQLKRFSASGKLDTYIDFPIHQLDLSCYIAPNNPVPSNHYRLFAVCNHNGKTRGNGHYTAFVHHKKEWFEFDDSSVYPRHEDKVKTPGAYLLFYTRVSGT